MNQQLGKYTILEELGRGGFGTVYKAEDPIGRIVALKVLHPGWDRQPDVLKRFQREALAGGSLYHQRIATILDIDEIEGETVPGDALCGWENATGRIKDQRKVQLGGS